MNQRWRIVALWLLPIGVVLLIGWQVISNGGLNSMNAGSGTGTTEAPRNAAVARMSYGRFLDYVEAGRVTAVDIYDGGRNAVIEAVDPDLDNRVQRLRVDLPGLAPSDQQVFLGMLSSSVDSVLPGRSWPWCKCFLPAAKPDRGLFMP